MILVAVIGLCVSANAGEGYKDGDKCTLPQYTNGSKDGVISKSVTTTKNDDGSKTRTTDYKCKSVY